MILTQEPPPHGTLSNTSPSNTAKKRETGSHPAPCFFIPSSGLLRPRPQNPMPRRAYERRNPHGASFSRLASPSTGDCMERTHLWPRLMPRARQPPTPRPWRATLFRQTYTPILITKNSPPFLRTAGNLRDKFNCCTPDRGRLQSAPCYKRWRGQTDHRLPRW